MGAIFCVVLLIQVVLFITQNSIGTELHELRHAKALQSFGFETLVLLPQSKKKPVKNKNGVKIVIQIRKHATLSIGMALLLCQMISKL